MKKKNKKITSELEIYKKSKNIWLYLVLALLVITNIISLIFYLNSDTNTEKHKISPLLNPLRTMVNKKDMIVSIQPLRDEINKLTENNSDISVYFEFLNTGANIVVNKDAEFFPASLSKLPLAMTVVKKIERGEWQWGNELVLMPTDKDNRFGNLYQQPIGTRITIENLVREMLVNSDNTAYTMILRNLEPEEFITTQKSLGLDSFFSNEGKISAKNYTVILRALYNSSYLEEANSEKLIKMMANSEINDFLSKGLPGDVAFSHKVGISDEKNVYLDAGIVYLPNRPYFLIVMVNTPDENKAKSEMKEISEKVYSYISNYSNED
ncbi:MAG: serine hydrolase [Patescibacteria group bacterium]